MARVGFPCRVQEPHGGPTGKPVNADPYCIVAERRVGKADSDSANLGCTEDIAHDLGGVARVFQRCAELHTRSLGGFKDKRFKLVLPDWQGLGAECLLPYLNRD
jgi:hypothetical protein